MVMLICGLVLFLGVHLVPTSTALRARLVLRLGDGPYRGLFSLVSAVGLALIVAGWWTRPERVQLFAPLASARAAAPLVVTIAFVLFAAANMRTHIRAAIRHPMLIGLLLWSGVHLLANGDLAGTVLFGSFFGYSILDLVSAARRHAVKPFVPSWTHDAIAVIASVALAVLVMHFHPQIFGTGRVV